MSFRIVLSAISLTLFFSCSKKNEHQHSSSPQLNSLNREIDSQVGSAARDGKNVSDPYLRLAESLKTTMLDCPAHIWPGYDWKKINVLMLQEGSPSRIWRGTTGRLEALDEKEIPAGARQGLYGFHKWQGEDALSISIDGRNYTSLTSSERMLFSVVVHEGFHMLGQREWKQYRTKRGTSYPIDSKPRLYRRMLFDNLKEYFLSNGSDLTKLGKASFWYEKWRNEFPNEVLATTDGYEGTASYVENMALAINEVGCTASDQDYFAIFSRNLIGSGADGSFGAQVNGDRLELDSEGYDIGSLAAYILRFIKVSNNWYDEVKNGKTPLDILLAGVAPVQDTAEANIVAKFMQSQDRINTELGGWIDDEIKHEVDLGYERIAFSSRSAIGSYSPSGFYLPIELPGITLIPLALGYEFKFNSWSMSVLKGRVLRSNGNGSLCPDASFVTLVAKSQISMGDNKVKISQPDIYGEMPGVEKTDAKGISWFCGE